MKTQDRAGFLKQDTESTEHKRLVNWTSLNLKASFHQKTLKVKPMTGGPCLKCMELTVDPEFIHSHKSIKKNPSLFEKWAEIWISN